jgi:tRNA(adenine34) deaminase
MTFRSFMQAALDEAHAAAARGEVPIGAVVVRDGQILAAAGNRTRALCDPTAHAEVLAIREACRLLQSERLPECDLYVTLEPCPICAGTIAAARIKRLYIGALDPKSGGTFHGAKVFSHAQCHHMPEIYDGIAAEASERLLRAFFAAKR